jgi:flagellar biosynthetic protein FliR
MTGLAVYFVLVLGRVGTGVMMLPLFGGSNMPRLVRLGLALALTVFWISAVVVPTDAELLNRLEAGAWPLLALALAREAVLGGLLGLAFSLFLLPARVAGEFIQQQMGLSLGATLGPTGDAPAGSLTLILETLTGLLFLGLDLHHVFLSALHATFFRYPVGGSFGVVPVAQLVNGVASAHEMGMMLAAPLALTLFLLTVSLALLTRAAPQLNLYSVGLPVQVIAGLGGLLLLAPEALAYLASSSSRLSEYLSKIL